MLRISIKSQTPAQMVLQVEGALAGADVSVLERELRLRPRESCRLVLDMTGVKHIDEAGLSLLRRWTGRLGAIRAASPFMKALLAEHRIA